MLWKKILSRAFFLSLVFDEQIIDLINENENDRHNRKQDTEPSPKLNGYAVHIQSIKKYSSMAERNDKVFGKYPANNYHVQHIINKFCQKFEVVLFRGIYS